MKHTLARFAGATALVVGLGACTPEWSIDQIFGPLAGEARSVAACESTMNPAAVSPGGGNHGLFQINDVHRSSFVEVTGQPWSMRYDAFWNTAFAKWLFDQSGGWGPWACQP